MATGALAKDPSWAPATDLAGLQQQLANIKKHIQNQGGPQNAQNLVARRQQVQQAITAMQNQTQTPATPQQPNGYQAVTNQANTAMGGLMDQIQNQGAFNPGSFDQLQNQAYQHVMNQFNTSMNPIFDQQNKEFQQRMAEQGIDPNSEDAKNQYSQMMAAQGTARQQAMDSAFGQGLSAENQAFGQAATQYQMPFQNLGAFSPFYQGQTAQNLQSGQQNFLAGQSLLDFQHQQALAAQQQKYNMALQNNQHGGGGGGGYAGLSLADQMALGNNSFYNNLALLAAQGGQQPPQGGYGNGIASGLSQGIGAGIVSSLK